LTALQAVNPAVRLDQPTGTETAARQGGNFTFARVEPLMAQDQNPLAFSLISSVSADSFPPLAAASRVWQSRGRCSRAFNAGAVAEFGHISPGNVPVSTAVYFVNELEQG